MAAVDSPRRHALPDDVRPAHVVAGSRESVRGRAASGVLAKWGMMGSAWFLLCAIYSNRIYRV